MEEEKRREQEGAGRKENVVWTFWVQRWGQGRQYGDAQMGGAGNKEQGGGGSREEGGGRLWR